MICEFPPETREGRLSVIIGRPFDKMSHNMSLQMIDIDERNIQCCRKTFGKRSSDEQRPHKSGASCERHRTQILRSHPRTF